jgi:hypothetical protein
MKRWLLNIGFFALLVLSMGLVPVQAQAQSISIKVTTQLTFPTIATPSPGNTATLTVSPLNSTTSGTGQILRGAAARGQYAISLGGGGSPVSITVDITGITTGKAGLTLSNFKGFYKNVTINSFPSPTLALPAKSPSSTPLYIGATETATSAVTAGNYVGSFTLTVLVQ